jgi:hypothetical protein
VYLDRIAAHQDDIQKMIVSKVRFMPGARTELPTGESLTGAARS